MWQKHHVCQIFNSCIEHAIEASENCRVPVQCIDKHFVDVICKLNVFGKETLGVWRDKMKPTITAYVSWNADALLIVIDVLEQDVWLQKFMDVKITQVASLSIRSSSEVRNIIWNKLHRIVLHVYSVSIWSWQAFHVIHGNFFGNHGKLFEKN